MKTKDIKKMIHREIKNLLCKKSRIKIKILDEAIVEVSLYHGKEHIQTINWEF